MLDWLKSIFKSKRQEPEKVVVKFVLPDEKKINIEKIKIPSCPKHPDYNGYKVPTNNCNDCWEYHSQTLKNKSYFNGR